MSTRFQFNPRCPEFHRDPYPTYTYLRTVDPVHRNAMGNWILTRYDDITAVLRDSRLGVHSMADNIRSKRRFLAPGQRLDRLADAVGQWLMFLNAPEHHRMRRLVSRPFTPAAVKLLSEQIQQTVQRLIAQVRPQRRMDVIRDLAIPLAVTTISDILGVPAEDRARVLRWTERLSHIVDPLRSLEEYLEMDQQAAEFVDYFRMLFHKRRRDPGQDLISALVDEQAAEQAKETELLSMCTNLFAAGQKTTVNFIGNGVLALLRNPDQLALLRERADELMADAMDELLRYDSPVQLITRLTFEPVQVRDKTIPAGSMVFLALGSANRDPEQFSDPDRLELTRKNNRHLAFAPGTHYCIGAMLAQVEGQAAIGAVVRELRDLKLLSDVIELESELIFRGPRALPISFSAGAPGLQ